MVVDPSEATESHVAVNGTGVTPTATIKQVFPVIVAQSKSIDNGLLVSPVT